MIVYEALHNSMIEESSYATLSLHRTREGAEKAINESKKAVKKEFDDRVARMSKEEQKLYKTIKWDQFQHWDISETELLD